MQAEAPVPAVVPAEAPVPAVVPAEAPVPAVVRDLKLDQVHPPCPPADPVYSPVRLGYHPADRYDLSASNWTAPHSRLPA